MPSVNAIELRKAKVLRVDPHSLHGAIGIQQALSQRRMSVDGEHHFFHRAFQLHHGDGLGDQLCGLRAEDMHAENLAVLHIGNDLHEAVVIAKNRSLGVARKREFAHLDREALFLGLRLGQANRTDLRLGIGAAGDAVTPHRAEFTSMPRFL